MLTKHPFPLGENSSCELNESERPVSTRNGKWTKWQSCDYPLFIILILKIIRKYSYRLCAVPPKWDQIPPWRMTIAFNCLFWTSNDPLKLGAGGGCGCVSQTQGCAGCISGLQPSHPSWKNVQALWSATSKLSCISMWRKFLKQAKKKPTGC